MHSFDLVDHTADVGIRARANTLAELLVACAEGMSSILVEDGDTREEMAVEIALEADDAEDLVHAWLRELLFRFSAEGLFCRRFEIEADETSLRATCHGERFDPARHHGGTEIKAVTYHGFKVEHGPEGWTAEVLFDV
ncbi:MAG TPA: archease [Planctomycetota bacterium]|nr:archease [Planctomycetota bacterium]